MMPKRLIFGSIAAVLTIGSVGTTFALSSSESPSPYQLDSALEPAAPISATDDGAVHDHDDGAVDDHDNGAVDDHDDGER